MSSRIVLASFPLALAAFVAGCGGAVTIGPPEPQQDDAGNDGGVSNPVRVDSGTAPAPVDSGTAKAPVPGRDGGVASPEASTGMSCMTTADCSAGQECAWPSNLDFCDVFNPAGTCVKLSPGVCGVSREVSGCGCDGKTVTWTSGCSGLPDGYSPEGLAYPGPCVDASAPPPSPVTCTSDADCAQGDLCGYEISLGCSATAQCVPALDFGDCNCVTSACGCDATTVTISCCATYASQPVASSPAPSTGCAL